MPRFAEGDIIELDGHIWTVEIVHRGASYESGRALLDPSYYILSSTERIQEIRMGAERTIYLPRQVTAHMYIADREAKLVRAVTSTTKSGYRGRRPILVRKHRRRVDAR
jgi:hypothetical protein